MRTASGPEPRPVTHGNGRVAPGESDCKVLGCEAVADEYQVVRRLGLEADLPDADLFSVVVKQPLLCRIGETHEAFSPPDCFRQSLDKLYEPLGQKRARGRR